MLKNVVVLTCGRSGSSVLVALIARAGLWAGDDTTNDPGYDTHENRELVDLNRGLIRAADFDWEDLSSHLDGFPLDWIGALRNYDDSAARAFVAKCDAHRPWIWKDPRLCHTMRFWGSLLNLSECRFVIMERDFRQAWSGHTIAGKFPISFRDFRALHEALLRAAHSFVRQRKLPHMITSFEALVLEPDRVVAELNEFLDTSLTLDDVRAAYDGPLGIPRWSRLDYLRAWAQYRARSSLRTPLRLVRNAARR